MVRFWLLPISIFGSLLASIYLAPPVVGDGLLIAAKSYLGFIVLWPLMLLLIGLAMTKAAGINTLPGRLLGGICWLISSLIPLFVFL